VDVARAGPRGSPGVRYTVVTGDTAILGVAGSSFGMAEMAHNQRMVVSKIHRLMANVDNLIAQLVLYRSSLRHQPIWTTRTDMGLKPAVGCSRGFESCRSWKDGLPASGHNSEQQMRAWSGGREGCLSS
jgi:hypothetical protein